MPSTKYEIEILKQALKDLEKIKKAGLKGKADKLLRAMQTNPFCNPPYYEKLSGDLEGAYSRRINIQHRLIYEVDKANKIIIVVRMWTHYE
jgi:toxin YoeB